MWNTQFALKLQLKHEGLGNLGAEARRMQSLNHPGFVRWYQQYDMNVTLNAEAILIQLCDGDCCHLLAKIYDRVGRVPLSPGSHPQPTASGQRWQTLAGGEAGGAARESLPGFVQC